MSMNDQIESRFYCYLEHNTTLYNCVVNSEWVNSEKF